MINMVNSNMKKLLYHLRAIEGRRGERKRIERAREKRYTGDHATPHCVSCAALRVLRCACDLFRVSVVAEHHDDVPRKPASSPSPPPCSPINIC
jgi:hypothetical protein